jgi:hypothetical protein
VAVAPNNPEPITPPPLGEGTAARFLAGLPVVGPFLARQSRRATALLMAVAVAVIGIAAWVFRDAGGLLLVGAFLGLLVVAGAPAARAAMRPVAALGRAAAPLGLIPLVFIAAGVVKYPPGVQLAIGLLTLLAAWYGLLRAEWQAPDNPIRKRPGDAVRSPTPARPPGPAGVRWTQIAAPILLPAALVAAAAWPLLDVLEGSGEVSAFLFLIAAMLVGSALVLRLLGYARTRLRGLVTVAVGLALTRLAMEAGIFPGHDWLTENAPGITTGLLMAIAGGVLALVALAEIVTTTVLSRDAAGALTGTVRFAAALEAPPIRRWLSDWIRLWGLFAAGLAALTLLLSVVAASFGGGAKEQFDEVTGEPISPGRPQIPPGDVKLDEDLAEMYSPVLVFTEDQHWSPTTVDEYLANAWIRDWKTRGKAELPKAPPAKALPTECPGVVPKPCYELTIRCETAAEACALKKDGTPGEARKDEAVYVRVERREDWPGRGRDDRDSPNPFANVGKYGADTRFLIQYWYFYPYDEWVAPVLGGMQFKQRHEADWEAVTIGLGESGPLFVAYSQHCGGTWSEWGKVRVANTPSRLRPLVAAAEGSQANYRFAEERRAPDWGKCAGVPADTLTLLSYASNIRDKTGSAWSWRPSEHLIVTEATPPMNFVGRWAPYSRTTLDNFREDIPLGNDSDGPATPPFQRLWQHPMRTIFGGGNWHHE